MKRLWVLGADDSEMRYIDLILTLCSEKVCYARSEDRLRRVLPSESLSGRWVLPRRISLRRYDVVVLVKLNPLPILGSGFRGQLLVMDNRSPKDLRVPPLYQVCTYLLGGYESLVLGAAEHNLAEAYLVFGEDVLKLRARLFGLEESDIWMAERYVDDSVKVKSVLVNDLPVPNVLAWDIALYRGWVALFGVVDEGRYRYVIGGVPERSVVHRLVAHARAKGYSVEAFPALALGSFCVDDPDKFDLVSFVREALGA